MGTRALGMEGDAVWNWRSLEGMAWIDDDIGSEGQIPTIYIVDT
jgi:hypothetical protein